MTWECVFVVSPYNGTQEQIDRNVKYAIAAMRDCLSRNEAPFLSHLIYTLTPDNGYVSDDIEKFTFIGRDAGIEAGHAWGMKAEKVLVYTDLGMSNGMKASIQWAQENNKPVEYRTLGDWNHSNSK